MDASSRTIYLSAALSGAVAAVVAVVAVKALDRSGGGSAAGGAAGAGTAPRRSKDAEKPAEPREEGVGTTYIHAGQEPDAQTGAVVPPISLATTFAQASPGQKYGLDMKQSFGNGWEYSRTGNPTRGTFERAVAASEGGRFCCAFASGMAATSTVLHLLGAGDHVIVIDDVYGGTQRYFRRVATKVYGMTFDFVDFNEEGALAAALKRGVDPATGAQRTKLLWLETPTNPTLKVASIRKAAEAAHAEGALLCVDNTFASPYFQTPLSHGADLVVHSVTKYIGGHSDVVMGVVVCEDEDLHARMRFIQNGIGAVPSPFDCYLALRGLKTLHVRMSAAQANAEAIAAWLERHPKVTKVLFPGLKSHPQHALAAQQMHGPGAMITFYLDGGIEATRAFLSNLRLFTLAESLGAVESLAEAPSVMTHASVPPEQRRILGIEDSLVRLSVGIESKDDLVEDLRHALDCIA